ncbi:site-2 protease family protein [Candidatus Woesearchaeota archaeon]|nr:site-2 protease family protein [Candidatus Woesearchaeota archaeon]
MDSVAKKFPRVIRAIGIIGIIIGYIGMIFIFYMIIKETIKFIFVSGTIPPLAPVLPGIDIPGVPKLSFLHWIISIFIVAVVHEFSHGLLARANNVSVKSSGFAFLGPILAAFVEPDEKEMKHKKKHQQLSILAAGPFSNILFGILVLFLISYVLNPIAYDIMAYDNTTVYGLVEDGPAKNAGLSVPFALYSINDIKINDKIGINNILSEIKPLEIVTLETDKGNFELVTSVNPTNNSRGYLGILDAKTHYSTKPEIITQYGETLPKFFLWFNLLCTWLFLISIGVGLFNLLPLGPVDGGRMFLIGLSYFIKNEKITKRIFGFVSMLLIGIIIINLFPYITKMISAILGIIALII